MRTFFPNSLELERRLRALGAHPAQLTEAFTRLENFQERFRDEHYLLMAQNQIDKDHLARTLAEATGTPAAEIVFLSCEVESAPRADLGEDAAACRERQYRTYETVRSHSIRSLIETKPLKAFAGHKDPVSTRRMIDVVKGAIGTRRLTLALDNTFGNSFASVFKHDIVAVWATYFMAFIPRAGGVADEGRIASLGRLVDCLTRALPIFYLKGPPTAWTVFTA